MSNTSLFENAKNACREIIHFDVNETNALLLDLADTLEQSIDFLLQENTKDLDLMQSDDPRYDRLKLTADRIKIISSDIRKVALLQSPLNRILEERMLPNGLGLSKMTVPLGVIGIIYEARPNVTFDVFSLCLKSGNVCLLKGGSDANFSNRAGLKIIHEVLLKHNLSMNIVQMLPVDKIATDELLHANKYVDVIIPRGSQGLIDYVRKNSSVPVIETGAGIVHTYFDTSGDVEKGRLIIANAKLRRVSVCNALDCLIIHRSQLDKLPYLVTDLGESECEIFADKESMIALKGNYPETLLHKATEDHFGTEFLSKKLAVKTVNSFEEAMDHIVVYSSKHSEAIIAEDNIIIDRFLKEVDSAAVYANASTAFTDGSEFGMGAEIGISTQKLHARGPMALEELTSYKWIIRGSGQTRET